MQASLSPLEPHPGTLLAPQGVCTPSRPFYEVLEGIQSRIVEHRGYAGLLSEKAAEERTERLKREDQDREDLYRYLVDCEVRRVLKKDKHPNSGRMRRKHQMRRKNKSIKHLKKNYDNSIRGYARTKYLYLKTRGNVLFTKYDLECFLRSLPLDEGRLLWAKRDRSFVLKVRDTSKDITIDNLILYCKNKELQI